MDINTDLKKDSSPDGNSSSSKLVLYSFWQSSCAWRVRFALNLKGLSYEYRAVNLDKGEHFSPEFEKLNPLHFVPVLVDGDVVVSDSLAILLYLEEKYPEKKLLPTDPHLRAVNLQAASIVHSSMQPLHMMGVLKYIKDSFGPEKSTSWAIHYIEKGFYALDKLLNKFAGKYATGQELSLADVFLAPQIAIASKRFNIDMVIRSSFQLDMLCYILVLHCEEAESASWIPTTANLVASAPLQQPSHSLTSKEYNGV